mgnify:CR=1 FL=1
MSLPHVPLSSLRLWGGLSAWGAAAVLLWLLDGWVDLGSQAMPLVLAAGLAGALWPFWASLLACVGAVLVFDWALIEPRGTLSVTLQRDGLLLLTLCSVGIAAAALSSRLRALAQRERRQARWVQQLYTLSERLRLAEDEAAVVLALKATWTQEGGRRCRALVAGVQDLPPPGPADPEADDELDGLALCQRECQPLGPGTGRYDSLPAWYLPLRGQQAVQGAVLLEPAEDARQRQQAQALADLAGQALERLRGVRLSADAARSAQTSQWRSTLMASVAHDYRTPLASILGAASALSEQFDRIPAERRQRLLDTLVDEARHLSRLTDNALQLARLADGSLAARRDWESVEELAGAVLGRVRGRDTGRRIRARISPGLPLLRCDALLTVQLIENLLDNALHHAPGSATIDLVCRRHGQHLMMAVRDRGPGLPATAFERLIKPYQQGCVHPGREQRGAGLGLALCDAVARAHGARLRVQPRRGGGASIECWWPLEPAPAPGEEVIA